ncbi:NADH dehydrogenase subunit J [Georgenia soli]|uniref:NADH-quinone oxidoreductase subunit J n=1 Tax=Georgenia soli TaxID=638953 RepID=A0A2A9ENL3_9MICO|nr:NADH-quinone oxidoreductase subunit J [Georgenia soli]PFG40373.1 NADH dehydrogenase subunit J [Georgenia soli]
MITAMLPASLAETGTVSTGETVMFWVLAPIMVLASLALLFSRRAVYAAMSVVLVMLCLAALYIAQEAPFLGVAQVVVYTGAIMMMFLFVLMLVGVDASDSLHETIKGQRWLGALAGVGLAVLLGAVVLRATGPRPTGLAGANADTNPVGVARLIFSDHVFAMELVGLLLIIAAVGAITLTHRERLGKKATQQEVLEAKMAAYGAGGARVGQLPAPGVYARSNAADLPALSATGEPINDSVPRVLRIRGQGRTIGDVSPETVEAVARARTGRKGRAMRRAAGSVGALAVEQTQMPSMRGEPAPQPRLPGSPGYEGPGNGTGASDAGAEGAPKEIESAEAEK